MDYGPEHLFLNLYINLGNFDKGKNVSLSSRNIKLFGIPSSDRKFQTTMGPKTETSIRIDYPV